jgi:hypothetical protein
VDFVIFGTGTGAALVLIGWLGRDLGPRLRDRPPRDDAEVLSVEELVARVSWARFCGSGGAALALCGALLLLATVATLVLRASDETGTTTMLATFGFVLVAMTVWSWAYVRRFGVYGVVRRRPRARPEPQVTPQVTPEVPPEAAETVEPPVSEPVVVPAAASVDPDSQPDVTPEPAVAAEADSIPVGPAVAESPSLDGAVPAAEGAGELDDAAVATSIEATEPSVVLDDVEAPEPSEHVDNGPDTTDASAMADVAASEEPDPTVAVEPEREHGTEPEIDTSTPDAANADRPDADASSNGTEPLPEPHATEQSPTPKATGDAATPTSEGLVDETPAPRRLARRRASPERRDYLARGRPAGATAPDRERSTANSRDVTRSEGET